MDFPRTGDHEDGADVLLLLGIDQSDYGGFALKTQSGGRTACALSVGSDPLSPGRVNKARHDVPNEDALLAIDEGSLTLLAVADAHYGHESSHHLLRQFAELARPIPANPLQALELLRLVSPPSTDAIRDRPPSATSLVLAILNRDKEQVFGFSFGDSSLLLLSPDSPPRPLNSHNSLYLDPHQAESLDPRLAQEFGHKLERGSLLLAFTDGIDSCHYNHPESSVTLSHIHSLYQEHDSPTALLEALIALALIGVPPHPGGQDNIATVCTRG